MPIISYYIHCCTLLLRLNVRWVVLAFSPPEFGAEQERVRQVPLYFAIPFLVCEQTLLRYNMHTFTFCTAPLGTTYRCGTLERANRARRTGFAWVAAAMRASVRYRG